MRSVVIIHEADDAHESVRPGTGITAVRPATVRRTFARSARCRWPASIALVVVLLGSTQVWAQSPRDAQLDLERILKPGMTVWITDSSGQEHHTRVVNVSDDVVTTAAAEQMRRFAASDIVRIRARRSDSVIDGALIGAGAGVAAGLFLCTRTEPWENCRDDVGPMLRIGAIGAGIGIGVDALIRGRKVVYEASPGTVTLHVAPVVCPGVEGLRVTLTF